MLKTFKQNITIDKLRQDEEKFVVKNKSDFISYREFIKYFNDLGEITEHNVIIGINFTYGWMPTCFDFQTDNRTKATQILNSAKQGQIPTNKELETLKNCFNNSLVGTSKLLHFINPKNFAIWDSRVYSYLTNKEPYSERLNKYESYIDFLKFCHDISSQAEFKPIHDSVIKKVGYEMTPYRTAEIIMYSNGKQLKKRND